MGGPVEYTAGTATMRGRTREEVRAKKYARRSTPDVLAALTRRILPLGPVAAPRAPASTPGVVQVSVRPGAISAPDSLPAGWTRVRVEESGGEHIVVVFRPTTATASASAVTAFLAALDTAPVTPRPGVALGGPEVDAGANPCKNSIVQACRLCATHDAERRVAQCLGTRRWRMTAVKCSVCHQHSCARSAREPVVPVQHHPERLYAVFAIPVCRTGIRRLRGHRPGSAPGYANRPARRTAGAGAPTGRR